MEISPGKGCSRENSAAQKTCGWPYPPYLSSHNNCRTIHVGITLHVTHSAGIFVPPSLPSSRAFAHSCYFGKFSAKNVCWLFFFTFVYSKLYNCGVSMTVHTCPSICITTRRVSSIPFLNTRHSICDYSSANIDFNWNIGTPLSIKRISCWHK